MKIKFFSLLSAIALTALECFGQNVQTPASSANLVPLRRLGQSGATNGQAIVWNAGVVNEDNSLGQWQAANPASSGLSPYASNIISGGTIPLAATPSTFVLISGQGVTLVTNVVGGVTEVTAFATNATVTYVTTNNVDYITVNTNTQVTITTNAYFTQNVTVNSNLTVNNTETINNSIVTNSYNISNFSQTISVSGKATLNQIILTNGFFAKTNLWAGPTNTVDLSIYDQGYQTVTPVSFTGFINYSNNLGCDVKFKIYNAAATNITVYEPAGLVDRDHVSSQVVTNGTVGIFWFGYSPDLGGHTNCVFNDF